MPAKGKHRRPKAQRLTRSIAVAGTGGAALALPLMGAAGAHAAPAQSVARAASEAAPAKTVQAAPVAQKAA
ncbi:peptidase, partial [Streptomyces sp. MBT97]|nr:peptidase [Streptomyces sp. MBT97]